MKKNSLKITDSLNFSHFKNINLAMLIFDSRGLIVDFNDDFLDLFEFSKKSILPGNINEIFNRQLNNLWNFIKNPSKKGFTLQLETSKSNSKFVKLISKKIKLKGKIFHIILLDDLSNFKDSMNFFEASFDHFMETTLKLENALATIEKQKEQIEIINVELEEKTFILNKDMEIASILQSELLPKIPDSPFWDISLCFKPMLGVSGDTFDFHQFPDAGYLGVVLLDASGHGVSSSLITNLARPVLYRNHLNYRNKSLDKAMRFSNTELIKQIGNVSNFLTGITTRLFKDKIEYINAGHPYMLFFNSNNGRISELRNDGILLGVPGFPNKFTVTEISVNPGDIFLLFTDGLIETNNSKEEEYGIEGIKKIIKKYHKLSAEKLKNLILKDLIKFGANMNKPADDMTFIIIKRMGEGVKSKAPIRN